MNNIDFEFFLINNIDIFHTINVESHDLKQSFVGNEWNILKSNFFSIIALQKFPQYFTKYDDDLHIIKGDLKYKISNCIFELKGRTNSYDQDFSKVENYVKLKPSKKERTDAEIIKYIDSKKPDYIVIHGIDTLLCISKIVLCSTSNCNFHKQKYSVDINNLIVIHQDTKSVKFKEPIPNAKTEIENVVVKLSHQQQKTKNIEPKKYTAFNENKTLYEWINDYRCVVPYKLVASRLNNPNIKMLFEQIITQPKNKYKTKTIKSDICDRCGKKRLPYYRCCKKNILEEIQSI